MDGKMAASVMVIIAVVLIVALVGFLVWKMLSVFDSYSEMIEQMKEKNGKALSRIENMLAQKIKPNSGAESDKERSIRKQVLAAEVQAIRTSMQLCGLSGIKGLASSMRDLEKRMPLLSDDQAGQPWGAFFKQLDAIDESMAKAQKGFDDAEIQLEKVMAENEGEFTRGSAMEVLKGVNERLFREIKLIRQQLNECQARASQAEFELQTNKAKSLAGNLDGVVSSSPDLGKFDLGELMSIISQQLQDMQADRNRIAAAHERLEEEMGRVLREKSLLEDRYLELDSRGVQESTENRSVF